MNPDITIRRAVSQADYRACREAQRQAWGISDDSYLVPIATMVGAQLHGGLVLGAFLPDGAAIGVSFAFLGRSEGRICLYSQLTGVIPGYQSLGLGSRMKQIQCDHARGEGIPLIAWAFDPFRAGNARFNLEKLGASSGRFVEDMYGPRTDALNAGMPTDRLIVDWETDPRNRPIVPPFVVESLPRLISVTSDDGPMINTNLLDDPLILLEVPAKVSGLQAGDPRLSEAWRSTVRRGFSSAFESGFRAVGFVGDRRCFYLLQKLGRSRT